jgi:MADS-box transcription factor
MGDAIHTMSLRDLKQMEGRLEKGISKIRARKVCTCSICAIVDT